MDAVTILFSLLFAVFPVFLTVMNIRNLFAKNKLFSRAMEIITFVLGPTLMFILYRMLWNPLPWYESTTDGWLGILYHEPVSNWTSLLVLFAIAVIGFLMLRVSKGELPPLLTVLSMAAMYMGSAFCLLFILQILPHIATANSIFLFEGFLMVLFPLNFIVFSISVTREIISKETKTHKNRIFKSKFLKWCDTLLSKSNKYPIIAFVLMFPLFAVVAAILVLFGQRFDASITAFTQTSDWLFSQKVAPAIEQYGYEYLCTAAAKGHKRVVKPIRMGMRGGKRIIVNRQLCVANAFEELLQKKTPKIHRAVRKIYDAVGCPLAKKIHKPIYADFAYIVIKPIEWFALFILYLFYRNPEEHIARQYFPIQ